MYIVYIPDEYDVDQNTNLRKNFVEWKWKNKINPREVLHTYPTQMMCCYIGKTVTYMKG